MSKLSEFVCSSYQAPQLRRALLRSGIPIKLPVEGYSMSPIIKWEDVVTVSPLLMQPLRSGDIAAFARTDATQIVIHRVVAVHKDTALTRGDNCSTPDELIPKTKILGRVTKITRRGRTVRLGLGPERVLIAHFSRWGLLSSSLAVCRRAAYAYRRAFHKLRRFN